MENKRICAILAGGPEEGMPCEPVPESAFILCADSGLHLAERLHRQPDLVLGDFDSLGAVPVHLPHMTVPVEKDDTDTMLAVRVALERGFRDIRIYGAFGGRLDHTLANLQTLEYLRLHGADGLLYGGESLRLQARPDWTLSLFAWSEKCEDVCASGVYYPLSHDSLIRSFPLGVSNHITADTAEISLGTGTLLIMQSAL